ncbi:hypothetical protein ACFOWA_10500 [Pedobacter lithocola]|uniref:Uncharacterized protein n=1 Tax=Pedobacter lithocola TaxID=1908239 RepID=A0ABV8PAD5_9SPHI
MKINKIHLIFSLAVLFPLTSCTRPQGNEQKKTNAVTDVQEFRVLFKAITELLKRNDLNHLETLMNFPFYTSGVDNGDAADSPTDPITAPEFKEYKSAIFNADVVRILPQATEDNILEIDPKTNDAYYKLLRQLTDAESKMFEVYVQYPESGTQGESYCAFVFGQTKGKYKVLATYAKWPVK